MAKRKTKSKKNVPRVTRSTDAAGADLGFSLQRSRFLVRLLEANDGDFVCLEVFDDVRLMKQDGTTIAEEDKSTLGRNPVADRSIDLWKTLANWVNASRAGNVHPEATEFELFVSLPREGQICTWFSEASDTDAANSALMKARSELWGTAPDFAMKATLAEGVAGFVDEVFENIDVAASIVAKFHARFGSGDQHADLRSAFAQELVGEDILDDVIRWANGWVKEKIDGLAELKSPAVVAKREFREALLTFVRHHDRVDFLRSFAAEPSHSEISAQQFMTYVRQLQVVEADDVDIYSAVNDYLRSTADRIIWADKGFVDDQSLLDFEKNLQRTWKNTRGQVLLEQKQLADTEQGKLIMLKCTSHEAKVDGLSLPKHFVPGSFHALANAPKLGWHPQYRDALKKYPPAAPHDEGGKIVGT